MPPFAPNGFAHNGMGSSGAARRPTSSATVNVAVDNMIRNQLKVSDVRDPKQIADALLNYYRDLPVAAAVRQEAQGLPFLQAPAAMALPPPQPTSSDAEFRIADNDVEKALTDLTTNPLTVDIVPEMQGWADSVRNAVAQGYTAARQGLDPTQRDKVIAIRRQLGEYGRMARFVGTLSPGMTPNYRRLGQALDEVSAVLLVMLGESLASVGFASGYYLLQVPLAELQQRRDSVIFALRNFMGGAQQAYGPDDWPRGIDAYRRLYNWLERQGQGDLRSLLIENEIAQIMDTLITRAQSGRVEGLRALGVTAQLDVERFRRMAIVAPGAMLTQGGHYDRSPPLETYLQALDLFANTFVPAGGLRLMRIARPPILYYGIYNPNLLDEGDQDLVQLIMIRGNLATIFDGLFPAAGAHSAEPQVLLDMLLLALDRAIDLLALEVIPEHRGQPNPTEGARRRAVAYWLIVRAILRTLTGFYLSATGTPAAGAPTWFTPLWSQPGGSPIAGFVPSPRSGPISAAGWLTGELPEISSAFQRGAVPMVTPAFNHYEQTSSNWLPASAITDPDFLDVVLEEIRVQQALEGRWENLVRTVSPEAGNQRTIFRLLELVVEQADYDARQLASAGVHPGPVPYEQPLPPQYEQTLERILGRIP
jgi:hypothetical protein